MLSLHNVSKAFSNQTIFKEISFELPAAQIIGLAGPSGSGKSTLLRCIQQLETIDSGNIYCDGATGFMFQDFQLFPHMTVMQNLIYAPNLKKEGIDYKEKAYSLLKQLGIGHKAQAYPGQLSGGQKQRVALARSLMMSPQVLLCDEPTSGLDVATIGDVVNLLKSVQDMGITMIIASHDLVFLTQIADKIILLKDGVIKTQIEPDKIELPVSYLKHFYTME